MAQYPSTGDSNSIKKFLFLTAAATHLWPAAKAAGFRLKATKTTPHPRHDYHQQSISTVTPILSQRHPHNTEPRPQISNNTLESFITFTFSDAAGNASATVLEQAGRGASKAARLNKDGHLIKDYYDLPKTAPQSALPVIIAFIKRPTSIPSLCSPP